MTIGLWVQPGDLKYPESDLAPAAAETASRVLWSLTGRIYSAPRSITETYIPASCSGNGLTTFTLVRYGIGPAWRVRPYEVGNYGHVRIPLRNRPVVSVQSVVVEPTGLVVDPATYWVSGKAYLTVDASVPTMTPLRVSYTHGRAIPSTGEAAARALANELLTLFGEGDSSECRLSNVSSLTRQGVTIEIEDARTILTDGRTGIPEVDLFVASVNPGRAKSRSRVLSPDSHFVR